MAPLIVMVIAIVGLRGIGMLGIELFADWQLATRAGLGVMFVFTGMAHFTSVRKDLIRMVPSSLPMPGLLVTMTGLFELAGAVGLQLPRFHLLAAYCLIALLGVMFPANVRAARDGLEVAGRLATPLRYRLPMQVLWVGLLWWSAQ